MAIRSTSLKTINIKKQQQPNIAHIQVLSLLLLLNFCFTIHKRLYGFVCVCAETNLLCAQPQAWAIYFFAEMVTFHRMEIRWATFFIEMRRKKKSCCEKDRVFCAAILSLETSHPVAASARSYIVFGLCVPRSHEKCFIFNTFAKIFWPAYTSQPQTPPDGPKNQPTDEQNKKTTNYWENSFEWKLNKPKNNLQISL